MIQRSSHSGRAVVLAATVSLAGSIGLHFVQAAPAVTILDEKVHHLGDSEVKDWPGVEARPEGTSLRVEFNADVNATPVTLAVDQRDVDAQWAIKLNGATVGELQRGRPLGTRHYELPARSLTAGINVLEFVPDNATDDVAVGPIRLHDGPLVEVLQLGELFIQVADASTGVGLPARVSIEAVDGTPVEIFRGEKTRTVVREGLIYLRGKEFLAVRQGRYRVAATRGMEWSRDVREIEVGADGVSVDLRLRREVDTTGFVAADTHLHTYEFSSHGDATAAERVLTLAGEGVEFAVATDHNHQLDYRPYQEAQQLNEYFTSVVGNEVTSDLGHFNGFPLPAGGEVPPFKVDDWVKLVEGIRLKGAQVVILNHPRWPDIAQSPFTKHGLNRASGDRVTGGAYTFDAMELVNSTVDTKDPLYLFVDWFALLNRGERISAVGSSDTHNVTDPAGQGRTYIRSSTDDPARLNVAELGTNIVAGRASVSLGIFADVKVNGTGVPGDLLPVDNGPFNLELRVAAPSWVRPRRALVFLNSEQVAEQEVPVDEGKPTDVTLRFALKTDGIDAHLVCVVLGDPVTAHGWKTLNDYTLAATNPVFLDVGSDGTYSSPRASAERTLQSLGQDVEALVFTLDVVPAFLGVQVVALASERWSREQLIPLEPVLRRLAETSPEYARYLLHRPPPQSSPVRP